MTDDPRDLIQRLADALDDHVWYTCSGLINEARAYLAAPDEPAVPAGSEPTDEQLTLTYALAVAAAVDGMPKPWPADLCERAQLAGLRAVLARWGSRRCATCPLSSCLAWRGLAGCCWLRFG